MAVGLDVSVIAIKTLNKFLEDFIQQYSVNSDQQLVANTVAREIQDDESSKDNQENIAPFDISTVQNPITKKRKGAPRVKHIKSSLETKNIQSITKKLK
ncbi:21015_t:CDS:2 [Racocetra persica]|uniref:21015_t:CDS:1 n=1 Tax=Racocetra persica TaxID=160502 RepID=A0ACA9KP71_9GLOM|nr:21015_t:CDS:2 [Racocetra persica]